ncbi:MAG TPA: TOBE domain-containing protein, partial [Beijerinckiaceae bacterium]|nr:TOBE domain-containing protein [Beijerinckiaceae bacterium]
VGTPEQLFGSPDHLDVAEFMGFRNQLRGKVASVNGDVAVVDVGATRISGRMREPVKAGDAAVVAIRPDNLMPVPTTNGGVPATLSASEFRGQEFVGFARTADGVDLSFRSPIRLHAGGAVHLRADPTRVLVFAGAGP